MIDKAVAAPQQISNDAWRKERKPWIAVPGTGFRRPVEKKQSTVQNNSY